MADRFHLGLPRMRLEPGERRAFLPEFVARLARRGAQVVLEEGYGSELGFTAADFAVPGVRFASRAAAYSQDYVLILRCPADEALRLMRPGACLLSMLHYPTRPQRVALLRELGLQAISLDSIKDDSGRRLIENLRAVAWNGVSAAVGVLRRNYPGGFERPGRPPIRVTLLGAGAVGSHVVAAATRYGDDDLRRRLAAAGVPGVAVTVVDYDLAGHSGVMRGLLAATDLLVDATQRPDPSRPVIPNVWLADLPEHAVLLDLSVDPYNCAVDPPAVKGIEGIPQGNLDQYLFAPDDPAWERVPACVDTRQRRWTASCYSWPGVQPRACMEIYGQQLQPILRTLIDRGGLAHIQPDGKFFERAIARALLSRWPPEAAPAPPAPA
jgi:alanine dehydrogenase